MPRASAMKVPAIEGLARELRFSSRDAMRRAVERIEELAGEIDGGTSYPSEWLTFRVTGYRPDVSAPRTDATIAGTELLADLSALAERLSESSGLTVDAAAREGAVRLDDLCARWEVSRKTVERWRRRGLIARRAVGGRARATLVFMPGVIARFEERHGDELGRAGGFSRIDPDTEERMVRRAAKYRRLYGWSASAIAARLAERFDRSREAVRRLLLRQGAGLVIVRPVRAERSMRRDAMLSLARGVEPAELATRWGVTRRAVVRAALLERCARLRELVDKGELAASAPPIFDRADAEEVILSPAPVRTGLGAPGRTDLLELIREARPRAVTSPGEESSRALAYHFLRVRAARVIAGLDAGVPRATDIDRAETMLRWAARLKAELVRTQLHLVLDTLDGLLEAPPEELPRGITSGQLVELMTAALGALGEAVDRFEPQRPALVPTGRLAAPAGLAVARACTRWLKGHGADSGDRPAKRAAARLLSGVNIPDWTRSVASWQGWLEPDRRVRESAREPGSTVLIDRFGWNGEPPRTLAELAAARRTTVARVAMRERREIRAAVKPAKGSGS